MKAKRVTSLRIQVFNSSPSITWINFPPSTPSTNAQYEIGGSCKDGNPLVVTVNDDFWEAQPVCSGGTWKSSLPDDIPSGVVTITVSDAAKSITASTIKDVDSPAISEASFTVSRSSPLNSGTLLNITVSFKEDVVVEGTPRLHLNFNSVTKYATYETKVNAEDTNNNELLFVYIVKKGDRADSVTLGNSGRIDGGTITDVASNPADSNEAVPVNFAGIVVDAEVPVLLSINAPADTFVKSGDSPVILTATFNEAVTVTGTLALQLNVAGEAAQATFIDIDIGTGTGTVSSSVAHSFSYSPGAGNDSDVQVTGISGGTIENAQGENLLAFQEDIPVGNLVLDNTAPVVTGLSDDAQVATSKTWAWDCNDWPNDNCHYRYVVDTTVDTTPGGSFESVQQTTQSTGTGQYYLHLQAEDKAGNRSSIHHVSVELDNEVAVVSGMIPPVPKTYILGENVDFVVSFSEDVVVMGAPRLELTLNSGTQYANYVADADGDGDPRTATFRYSVIEGHWDDDGIELGHNALIDLNQGRIVGGADVDANLSALSLNGLNLVQVDGVKPTLTTIFAASGHYKKDETVDLTVTFNEPVQVSEAGTPLLELKVGNDSIELDFTGDRETLITELSFTYTVQDGHNDDDGIETVGLDLNGASIQDKNGNNVNSANNPPGQISFILPMPGTIIDTVLPTVAIIDATNSWDWSCNNNESCTYRHYVGPETPVYTIGTTAPYGEVTTATSLDMGSSYVHVQAKDAAGNESAMAYAGPFTNLSSAEFVCGDLERSSGFNGGDGTAAHPYLICTYTQLNSMRNNLNAHYKLGQSIDADATSTTSDWGPIGSVDAPFQGQLDGNAQIISNFRIDGAGLFAVTGSNARIFDVDLVNATGGGLVGINRGAISGSFRAGTGGASSSTTAGGLVGTNEGSIINSYATGNVTATATAGGLVGSNEENGLIVNSYATGGVTAPTAGGLVGSSEGSIINSYGTGEAAGVAFGGGLLGVNKSSGTVQNSYATGEASATTASGGKSGGLVGENRGTIGNCYSTESGQLVGSNSGTLQGSNFFIGEDGKTEAELKALASASGWTTGAAGNWNFGTTSEFPRLQYTQWANRTGDECGGDTGVTCGDVIQGQFGDNLPPQILTEVIRLPLMPNVLPDHANADMEDEITKRAFHYRRSPKVEYYDLEDGEVTYALESQTNNNPNTFCKVDYYANPITKKNIPSLSHCLPLVFAINPKGFIYIKDQRFSETSEGDYFPAHDFKEETLTVALTETGTSNVTRKQIRLLPSLRINDCRAHASGSVAEFECLYLQELPAQAQNAPDPTLQADLPNLLVQPKEDYRLVFREEFNGEGFKSLDKKIWTVFEEIGDAGCRSTITGGVLCLYQGRFTASMPSPQDQHGRQVRV